MTIMQDTLSVAAFISAGMHGSSNKLGLAVDSASTGHLEFINAGISYAPYLVELAEAGYRVAGEFPGVFEYEVCEPFGARYVAETLMSDPDAPSIPDHTAMCCTARNMALEFFAGNSDKGRAKLRAALDAVPLPPAPAV